MKVFELIQILCQNDPNTEVLATSVGFPFKKDDLFVIECVYDHHPGPTMGDVHGRRRAVVLTTRAAYETKGHSSEG